VVLARLGLPVPFRVAVFAAIAVAAVVTAVGAEGVTNVTTLPNARPTEFCPIAQK
jgi:hypothetical protein